MHEQEVKKAYNRELLAAFAIYAVMLVASIRFGRGMEPSLLRTMILVSPMIGFMLAVWAIARQFRRIDEYIRQITLENLAMAAAVTAGVSFTYGFLESAGFPRLSMFTVWPIMGGAWFVLTLVRCRRAR
jgi:hypothetical protein